MQLRILAVFILEGDSFLTLVSDCYRLGDCASGVTSVKRTPPIIDGYLSKLPYKESAVGREGMELVMLDQLLITPAVPLVPAPILALMNRSVLN